MPEAIRCRSVRNTHSRDRARSRRRGHRSRVIASAIAEFDTNPDQLAHALRTYLGADGVATLVTQYHRLTVRGPPDRRGDPGS
jgi:hypothetical protein